MSMTAIRQEAIELLEELPEDKLMFIIQIMQGVKGLYGDNKSEKEKAFSNLERLKKKGTGTDYDMELASYRECAKSFRADYIITRNVNDYKESKIPAVTPEEFINKEL